jgi:DNA-binding transcriptional MocR family regulator
MTNWQPQNLQQPGYHQLVTALQCDIQSGRLRPGQKLPPIRRLAQQLNINPTTVARAYREAEQKGLLHSQTGQGTFVAGQLALERVIRSSHEPQLLNLSIIQPLLSLAEPALQPALAQLASQMTSAHLGYPAGNLLPHQRRAALDWLDWLGIRPPANHELLPVHGAQQGLQALLLALSEPGETVAGEALCYPGLIALCQSLGRPLHGFPLDEQGLLPDAVDDYCRQNPLRLLFVTASQQNPTTAIMSLRRRQALIDVARRHRLTLIDDDIYGFTVRGQLPSLYQLAPDCCISLTSLSKCLLPGLRCGFLCLPAGAAEAVQRIIRTQIWMPSPLGLELSCQLIASGAAEQIALAQLNEAQARQQLAYHALGSRYQHQLRGLHGWLHLPDGLSADQLTHRAEQAGVLVSSASYFISHPGQGAAIPAAVRLGLMATASREELQQALQILQGLLTAAEPLPSS